MLPFNNAIYLYALTGEDILSVFEYSLTSAGKGLFSYVSGIDCYYEDLTVHALVKDGVLIYQDGEWFDGWEKKTFHLAANEYIATTNRTSDSTCNPLVSWNNTDKLIDHNAIDVDCALVVLREESSANDGYLFVDDSMYFVKENYERLCFGDVDGDGNITIMDATAIQKRLSYFECMLFSTVVSAFMSSRNYPPFDRNYVVILGCAIRRDGSLTPILKGRADAAISFAEKQFKETGKRVKYIPSGGQGSDETISEGEAIKRYLIIKGVDEKDILPEMKSVNTFENLKYSKEIIESDSHGEYYPAFATTNYHIFRGYILSKKIGLNNA